MDGNGSLDFCAYDLWNLMYPTARQRHGGRSCTTYQTVEQQGTAQTKEDQAEYNNKKKNWPNAEHKKIQ